MERKAALLGLDAIQRIDLQVMSEPKEAEQGFDRVYAAIMRVARGPDWRPGDGKAVDAPPPNDGDGGKAP